MIAIYIFAVPTAIAAGLFILARYLESTSVFFPSRGLAATPSEAGLPWEDVYFQSADKVRLNGWFVRSKNAVATVIFVHGNAGNIGDRLLRIKFFHDLGLNIFIFDYRGYGRSEGKPSEAGIYLDAQGAYDHLQSRADVNMNNIVLYGASLGGAVAIDLATRRNAALLVVEGSFTSALDMARIHYPFVPPSFLRIKFNSIDKVRSLSVRKLFIHSQEDEVVPYGMGQRLFEAAARPKEFLKIHGGHNEASMAADPSAVREFVKVLKARSLI